MKMRTNDRPLAALTDFLSQRFEPRELRNLPRSLRGGADVARELSDRGSSASLAEELVDLLDRRGLIDDAFFALVRSRRPKFSDALTFIERNISGTRTPAGRLRESTVAALAPVSPLATVEPGPIDTWLEWLDSSPTEAQRRTGRMFGLWPVAEQAAAQVIVEHAALRYALSTELPVLMVVGQDHPTSWRWVDASLLPLLGHAGATVQVPIPSGERNLRQFVERTLSTVERPRWRWDPGAWRRLHSRAGDIARRIRQLSTEAETAEPTALTHFLGGEEGARFTVAIAGPMKAGKSTFINALVEKKVSPVNRVPATAVPVHLSYGDKDRAEVLLQHGATVHGTASTDFLQSWATQEANRDNHKGVSLIQVLMPSDLLSQGVTIVDVPGLHDPSATISSIAEAAVASAHAVLYLVSGARYADGDAVIDRAIVNDLREYTDRARGKVLLLVNKVDKLNSDERKELSSWLSEELCRQGLHGRFLTDPLFVSAEVAWKAAESGKPRPEDYARVLELLWSNLLENGEAGFRHLRKQIRGLQKAVDEIAVLLSARRLRGAESARLHDWVHQGKSTVEALLEEVQSTEWALCGQASQRLALLEGAVSTEVGSRIRAVPLTQELPSDRTVRAWIHSGFESEARALWLTLQQHHVGLSERTNTIIERELRQARAAAQPHVSILPFAAPQLHLSFSPESSAEEGFLGAVGGGFIGALFGPGGALFGALAGLLGLPALGRERRRKKDVDRYLAGVVSCCGSARDALNRQAVQEITRACAGVRGLVHDRLQVFIGELQRQLTTVDSAPLTQEELARLDTLENEARMVAADIAALADEVFRSGAGTRT